MVVEWGMRFNITDVTAEDEGRGVKRNGGNSERNGREEWR